VSAPCVRLRGPLISLLFPYTTLFRSLLTVGISDADCLVGRTVVEALPKGQDVIDIDTAVEQHLDADGPAGVDATARMRLRRQLQIGRATRLNSSHVKISYAVFCLKKK